MPKVYVTKKDSIAYVILNRPEELNSLDYGSLKELNEIVLTLSTDLTIKAVVFSGTGMKAFCAGADLKERKTLSEQETRRNVYLIRDVFNRIEDLPQPTIAMINGYALGGGLELALVCDFRFAASEAQLGLTEINWAIIPGAGGTQRLPKLIGISKAKQLIYSGKKLNAIEAKNIGLIDETFDDQESLEAYTFEFLEPILLKSSIALQQAKYAINKGNATDLRTGIAIESKAYELTIGTGDRKEALLAFQEKRDPVFRGS
ncbi:enoyl-CoA hydratase-related protein [Peribacillus butanolivorans]|uniref:enoyl-CoA hydratase-related protein n=1 Tax=Peribacillus butanolivorans TaxID=421767 RepID=UPI0038205983